MNLPNKIKEIIGDMSYSIDTIGMSNSKVICFGDMVLKLVYISCCNSNRE